ncbi:MAG: hypothetical protein PF904_15620 [Kiritimatiellae bacterium]|jgi:hypothetical protein|nr:hypothetical protein [Kiritimatiellia bacterium]
MKKLCYESLRTVSVVFLMICLAASSAYSGIVFEAGFRGPGNGAGGPYDLVNLGGSGYVVDDSESRTLTGVINDNPMPGGGTYLSCVITNPTSDGGVSMIKFVPDSAASSLDAMTDVVNGDRVINGGFDFFFRSDTALLSGEMRNMDEDNKGNGGLRFVFTSQSPGLRLEIISSAYGLFSGGEGGSSNNFQYAYGSFTY